MSKAIVTRNDYMDGKVDHFTYYCTLADAIGRKPLEGIVKGIVRQSTTSDDWLDILKRSLSADEHLNNIPLHLWDARDWTVKELIRHGKVKDVMEITWPNIPYDGKFYWSLCETVCVLKSVAKRMALSEIEATT